MAKEIKLPELGENVEEANVLNVLVKAGDKVEKDQGLLEIETDKATVEVPSEEAGTVKEVKIKAGDKVKTGQVIVLLESNGEDIKENKPQSEKKKETVEEKAESVEKPKEKEKKPEKKKKESSEVVDFQLPDLGENIESANVLNVLVSKGDNIERDQGLLEIETDKATVEVPSEISGTVKEVLVKSGDQVKTGQVLFKISSSDTGEETDNDEAETSSKEEEKEKAAEVKESEEPSKDQKEKEDSPGIGARKVSPGETDNQPPITKGSAPAAPSVRRLAREIGVNINEVKGSASNGRITMEDVKAHSKKLHEKKSSGTGLNIKAEKLPDFSKFGEIERKPMSGIRSKTADHLSYAWATIPHVTQHDKADITELEKMRKAYSPTVEKEGAKLTVTSILVKVLIAALRKYPQFNASIDMENKEVIYKKYFNIGIAVDTEHGLIVPVLKDAEDKDLTKISVDINNLAEKARARKISMDDLQGACITITNLGGIGGTSFTPIVNAPEVAILGVSRGSFEPLYNKKENTFEPRLMLPLSLSYDHRIIDGADAARFLRYVCEVLEQPLMIL